MNVDVVLALMSVTLVLPAMVGLLYLVFSGRFSSTEESRTLPLLDYEEDFWQHEPRRAREKAR